ncbi:hypothetical protein CHS0354_021170 [Potamilus streckersoni]|uniref:SGNH hydrolase-type esterase domain-containing protein n=1 Tax=Potamilus streckersoni TaxID=2493646 RepID=A0AAE0S2A7_9BIVA|nr:hypothetical protein CHS0354_021170 [Potamilus streckersoni]
MRINTVPMNPAAVPQPVEDVQGDDRWMSQHHRFLAEIKEKEPEVVFIGDSLIRNLSLTQLWKQMFEPLHCLNLGIGGDQTQNVLWRVLNGELEEISPKVIVLLVGTNNYDHTAEQVTDGILEIVHVIQSKQPQAQVIVTGIPPRGEKPNPLREKIIKINGSLAEECENLQNVTFLNVDPSLFVNQSTGLISATDMYDYLHLTQAGYQKLSDSLLEEIQNLLQEFIKVENTSIITESIEGDLPNEK